MAKSLWLLTSVAFGVSFILSLLVSRDLKTASTAGLMTVPATFAASIAVNRQQRMSQKRAVTALQMQIRQMEKWKVQMQHSLWAIASEQQRNQNYLTYRQKQLNQLYVQTTEQQKSKQQLSLDLISMSEQIRQLSSEIFHLEQQKEELDLEVRSSKLQKHQSETQLNSLQVQIEQLQADIVEQLNRKTQLEALIDFLVLQLRQFESAIEPKDSETDLNIPIQKLLTAANETPLEQFHDEWSEFSSQLTDVELQVLKALVEQEDFNVEIKKIAESNLTMPELLINAINERAIAAIGDIIIESGLNSPVITDAEYLTNVKKIINCADVK